ncbi:8639_t:CDS:1, partial [Entrophospora sp. SA101]
MQKDKERITILFCCNASGKNKNKPLVIGKSQKPRCFNHINIETLPVKYSNSTNAWMTMELWNDWLKWFDSQLKKKSILLIDNCPAHTDGSHLGLKNLHVIYLPPNTTSHIQPCDAGIIHNFK